MSTPLVAYFDGLCEPTNPKGWACGGWVIEAHDSIRTGGAAARSGWAVYGHGEGMTNNVAEYQSALSCLRVIYWLGWRGPVVLRGDSQLVVRQYTGQYSCGAPLLVPLLAQLKKAATFFESVTLEWISREQNLAADAQSRLAYQSARRSQQKGA